MTSSQQVSISDKTSNTHINRGRRAKHGRAVRGESGQRCDAPFEVIQGESNASYELLVSWPHKKDMGVLEGVHVESDDGEQMWWLAKRDQEMSKSEEMVFTATGALAHMDLPPVVRETPWVPKHTEHAVTQHTIQGNEREDEVPQLIDYDNWIQQAELQQCDKGT